MLQYSITVDFDAPLKYAYAWCTDFRDEDPLMVSGRFTRHIIRRKQNGFVWIQHYMRDGKEREGVRIITLGPPDAWHNDAINEEKESQFDYRITALGRNRTRLVVKGKISYKSIDPEKKADLVRSLSADWDKYKAALERDYMEGKAATE